MGRALARLEGSSRYCRGCGADKWYPGAPDGEHRDDCPTVNPPEPDDHECLDCGSPTCKNECVEAHAFMTGTDPNGKETP
jgi:hypothetical protein